MRGWPGTLSPFLIGTFPPGRELFRQSKFRKRQNDMDKDRIKGSAEQAKGKVKEIAGKITGDAKLESEGKTDKTAGKIQNAVGGFKDALRGK
jgi:uncharacterized protein YjbJ (UPF0337 family)